MVVPTFGLSVIWNRVEAEIGDTERSDSDSSGRARIGVGLIFNRNVGITPSVSIPFSSGSDDAVFDLQLTFNFGR
jgi:hypothetical protein